MAVIKQIMKLAERRLNAVLSKIEENGACSDTGEGIEDDLNESKTDVTEDEDVRDTSVRCSIHSCVEFSNNQTMWAYCDPHRAAARGA